MNIRSLLAILMLVSVTSIHSQNILTKEQAITFALENNFGIKIAKNNVSIAANDKGVLNTGYLPTSNILSTFKLRKKIETLSMRANEVSKSQPSESAQIER